MQRCYFALPLFMVLLCANSLSAAVGDPLAVRLWPGGVVTVETHWGLTLQISDDATQPGEALANVDKIVSTSDKLHHFLAREPNDDVVTWAARSAANKAGWEAPDVISVISSGGGRAVRIDVDGVRVIVGAAPAILADQSLRLLGERTDVLVITSSVTGPAETEAVTKMVSLIGPRTILLSGTGDEAVSAAERLQSVTADVTVINHNTLAVASTKDAAKTRIVVASTEPWEMPADLSKLFAAMEKSCEDSQQIFAKLSIQQMNFKPANGTHTPRWNTEHMMGRQLQFFSQIYHAVDATIPVMDLNPKQMPPDYRFRHADWTGAEEARQMDRVSKFTRRFAYLLDGLDVNKRAPGSRWPSLQALLGQMFRHYSEHTANTVKKFDLPGFPAE